MPKVTITDGGITVTADSTRKALAALRREKKKAQEALKAQQRRSEIATERAFTNIGRLACHPKRAANLDFVLPETDSSARKMEHTGAFTKWAFVTYWGEAPVVLDPPVRYVACDSAGFVEFILVEWSDQSQWAAVGACDGIGSTQVCPPSVASMLSEALRNFRNRKKEAEQ